MKNSFFRIRSLIYKEFCQIVRDKSTFLIGIILPMMLIVLIGSGMSLDVKNIPVAVVLEDSFPLARDSVSFLNGSEYFEPHYVTSMKEAEALVSSQQADSIIRIPSDFSADLYRGKASVQVILNGVNTTTATSAKGYITAGFLLWMQSYAEKTGASTWSTGAKGGITIVSRQWFNDANSSTYLFIPGLIVIVMTLVGVFLTALVMAREWERGTLESLFVTPVRPIELIVSKIIPYFLVASLGFLLCVSIAVLGYDVPLKGSWAVLAISSAEYIIVAVCLGLTISSIVKKQFLACQMALFISLLPTVMLSGFIFDLHSVPYIIRIVGHIIPATYYMELVKTIFLAGNNWTLIIRNGAVLAGYATLFFLLSLRLAQKRLS